MTANDLNGLHDIAKQYDAELLFNERLAPYTSFRIGGPCFAMFKPRCEEALTEAVIFCETNDVPFHIMGKGSNVLVSGKGTDSVVILTAQMNKIKVNDSVIISEAGATLSRLCRIAEEHSLTGAEFAYGIPGTVGGALYMNAGAYGGEISDIICSCRYVEKNGIVREISSDDMKLSYRHSVFKENKRVILSAELQLKIGDRNDIKRRMSELTEKRKEKQPLDYPSAGSTFKRPPGGYAAALIDECGLKGFSCGGAMVSEKHAGFVVNTGDATFDDVIGVIEAVRERVLKRTGITLECEVEILK